MPAGAPPPESMVIANGDLGVRTRDGLEVIVTFVGCCTAISYERGARQERYWSCSQ